MQCQWWPQQNCCGKKPRSAAQLSFSLRPRPSRPPPFCPLTPPIASFSIHPSISPALALLPLHPHASLHITSHKHRHHDVRFFHPAPGFLCLCAQRKSSLPLPLPLCLCLVNIPKLPSSGQSSPQLPPTMPTFCSVLQSRPQLLILPSHSSPRSPFSVPPVALASLSPSS